LQPLRRELPVDITVYLPDEIGAKAKEADLPFSRMLRDAIETEFARRAAIADTLGDGVEEHEVELQDVTGVITGKFLGETDRGEQIFVTDDERVLVYHSGNMTVEELNDPEAELSTWLENSPGESDTLGEAMRALGMRPRVRL
jgi:hypothetical protein